MRLARFAVLFWMAKQPHQCAPPESYWLGAFGVTISFDESGRANCPRFRFFSQVL
jgi:hypothetical protein